MGAVNRVVDHADLESVGLEWASKINGKSPQAQRMLKFAFNLLDDGLVGQQIFASEATRLAYMTDEAVEGRDASWRSVTRTGAGSRGISSRCPSQGVYAVRRFHPSGRCGAPGSEITIAVGNLDIDERCAVRTKAAVLWELGGKWEVDEVDLDPPKAGEVMIKLTASGLCHSDHHLVTGDIPVGLPYVGGHEAPAWSPKSGRGSPMWPLVIRWCSASFPRAASAPTARAA